ncbi:MAG TPA: hypothetical protein VGS11_10225 [Candidatus Bathyarchaeia archaeon]|nr:hypothetical protein [Candidatus Bathyarchaeia archaeon]
MEAEYVTDTKGGAGLRVIDCGRSMARNPFLLMGLDFTSFLRQTSGEVCFRLALYAAS